MRGMLVILRWVSAVLICAGSAAQAQLVPVRIASESPPGIAPTRSLRTVPQVSRRAASIEIELAGGVRVRVGEDVSLAALRRVISALRTPGAYQHGGLADDMQRSLGS